MDLSIVDLSPVPAGQTATDAFKNTVTAAQQAEELGYSRFWVAEHHGMGNILAGTTPEVLLGHLAAKTDSIRLGSGAILLNNYSAFKVAEVLGTLDGLAPGRIDAGLGRANGSEAVDQALETQRYVSNPDEEHSEKIKAVLNHLHHEFPDGHPYSGLSVPRSDDNAPVPWVLGSSSASAKIAAALGLRFCFAAFIRPQFATHAFETYRREFEPSTLPGGLSKPYSMVALNAICAETDEAAAELRSVAEATYKRMQRGVIGTTPTVETAIDELGGVPKPTPATLAADEWPRSISGSPDTVQKLITQLADRVGADEVMIQHAVGDHADGLRSHELIADVVGL
ncbi:LLM class flavin-dependent oxidoreductase [Halorubraceae archaeon YAN]|nr:LLM class flavin-dependent oxidoreductase [Halorubraceae archaeon YAN]